MKQTDIDALGSAAYATKLMPGKILPLGEHVQVYAAALHGTHARRTHKYLTLTGAALYRPGHAVTLTPDQFPAPGKRGINVPAAVRVLWDQLDTISKTRVVFVVFGSAVNYGPLDVHDLDPRVKFHEAGGDAYALNVKDHGMGEGVEFLDLEPWFPEQELPDVLASLRLMVPAGPLTPEGEARAVYDVLNSLRVSLMESWGVDIVKYRTPAACAARAYVGHYLQVPVGGTQGVRKYIRDQGLRSSWGSRVEAFTRGKHRGDFAQYDAVSLYPQAVLNLGELPTANSWFRLTAGDLRTCRGGICTVEFDFRKYDEHGEILPDDEQELYPCLPVSTPGALMYPLSGVSHCTVHEVRYALELGARVRLVSGYGYNRGDSSLATYSAELLQRKNWADATGNYAARTLYKLLMNSLYGKFSQHMTRYSLETLRGVARALKLPDVATLDKIPNWEAQYGDVIAGGEGEPLTPEVQTGGQWCPEWAALIQGYARYIESRAMREYVALCGTTDSVLIHDAGVDSFEIDGVTFRREYRADHVAIVRARLYALAYQGQIVKAALHGAPKVAQMPAALFRDSWDEGEAKTGEYAGERVAGARDSVIRVSCARVRKIRDGIVSGNVTGKTSTVEVEVSMAWDRKRQLIGDYSLPWAFIGDEGLTQVESEHA